LDEIVVGPDPLTWDLDLLVDGQETLTKCVQTPLVPPVIRIPNIQVYFLCDTTGSMGGVIDGVKSKAIEILTAIGDLADIVEYGVGEYRDFGDMFVYRLNAAFTSDTTAASGGINMWFADEGGDQYEAQLFALKQLSDAPPTGPGWASDKAHVLIWFGDEPGHDPSGGVTLDQAIAALQAQDIYVIALDAGNLNGLSQATDITAATAGLYVPGLDVANIKNVIVDAIKETVPAQVNVIPNVACNTGLSVTFDPPSQSGVAGSKLCMAETLTMTGCVRDTCSVAFEDGMGNLFGEPQQITVYCSSPPDAKCKDVAVVSPGGCHPAPASVDDGSFDPAGDPITCTQSPAGPYAVGATSVTLTCVDAEGLVDTCTATVTVADVDTDKDGVLGKRYFGLSAVSSRVLSPYTPLVLPQTVLTTAPRLLTPNKRIVTETK
jgi:hypothetical protein